MSDSPEEPRTWDSAEEADAVLEDLKRQVETLRAKIRIYHAVVTGDDPPPEPEA